MGILRPPHAVMLACIIQHSLGRMGSGNKAHPEASIHHDKGHYPPNFIRLTNVVLNLHTGVFNYKNERGPKISIDSITSNIWLIKARDMKSVVCDKTFDIAYIFLVYHHYGSNYFHIHYDSILPIYQQLYYENDHSTKSVVLMPSVETKRLEIINWNTTAFSNPEVYWMSLLQIISGTHTLSPLTESLRQQGGNICMHAAYFGTPKMDFADSKLILSYVSFIKNHLGVNFTEKADKIGIIKRTNRRKILNEEELIASMSDIADTRIVDFSGMSFSDQVHAVQEFSVLVGVNGAGLMNALYLPPTSVAVQLVPFNASVNFNEFGALLKGRGPYMEWHNSHRELTRVQEHDVYMSQADTFVSVDEFQQLMKDALEAAQHARVVNKQEL